MLAQFRWPGVRSGRGGALYHAVPLWDHAENGATRETYEKDQAVGNRPDHQEGNSNAHKGQSVLKREESERSAENKLSLCELPRVHWRVVSERQLPSNPIDECIVCRNEYLGHFSLQNSSFLLSTSSTLSLVTGMPPHTQLSTQPARDNTRNQLPLLSADTIVHPSHRHCGRRAVPFRRRDRPPPLRGTERCPPMPIEPTTRQQFRDLKLAYLLSCY